MSESGLSNSGGVEYTGSCELPTPWANFRLHGFVDVDTGKEHLALTLGDLRGEEPVLARVHSECLTTAARSQSSPSAAKRSVR